MLRLVLLFHLLLCTLVMCKRTQQKEKESSASADDLGGQLVTSLRNDVNIDLSADEEYEDLRAELLAYHTALASITPSRRSMKTTPCWKLGGICIHHKMCEGHRFMSEVEGCRRNLEVCCFVWNGYQVRDMKDKGLNNLALPWNQQFEIGGKGIIASMDKMKSKKKKRKTVKVNVDDSRIIQSRTNTYKEENNIGDIPVMVIIRNNKD
ncbi:uncharacterized protein LOC111351331 [Spodoptera litura]|uniref:Uncharacterized protein LOC111351331 n=1 Tax=Spodoptera litura TaxID=69820 RepID=A0A9J7IPY6_SPOLT|nr:uncharacterized protein LOC111351331 [Spodoptera litura]